MANTCSELYIKKIESGIRSIRLGTKKPSEVSLDDFFEKLRPLNDGMAMDLREKYDNVVKDWNRKNHLSGSLNVSVDVTA